MKTFLMFIQRQFQLMAEYAEKENIQLEAEYGNY